MEVGRDLLAGHIERELQVDRNTSVPDPLNQGAAFEGSVVFLLDPASVMTTQVIPATSAELTPYIDTTCPAITVRRGRPEQCGRPAEEDGRCAEHAERLRTIGV